MLPRFDTVDVAARADAAAAWLTSSVRGSLRTDSRLVQPGDGFIAWPGHRVDGRQFVPAALAAGAAACLVESDGYDGGDADARVAALPGLKASVGAVASAFYGHPSRSLRLLAVTGTNGKTSTAWWTAQALGALGRRCGLIGTLGIGEPGQPGALQDSGLTTPDAITLQRSLRGFADAGFVACALEASSIGLAEQRLAGTAVEVALFSNFSRDHIDHHGSMDAYREAKRALFRWPGLRAAVLNIDDPVGAEFAETLLLGNAGSAISVRTVSTQQTATLRAGAVRLTGSGLAFTVHEGDARVDVQTRIVGDYNVHNLLLVLGALRALDVPLDAAARAIAGSTPVPGRLQIVQAPAGGVEVVVVVDYAHTPDALDKCLQALRPLADVRQGRLWCVFGCGGNRDTTKRPLMGAVAAARADHVVLTSDNPRDEAPAAILAQILAGLTGHDEVDVIDDRRAAIADAIGRARAGDVVLLAGKGHETTQETAGVKRPFSDVAEAEAALARRGVAA